jgi:hypothetical protein
MNMSKFLQAADPVYKNPILAFPLTAVDSILILSNEPKLYAIPSGTELIMFNATKDIYVLFGDEEVIAELPSTPGDDVLDGTASMLNPGLICGITFSTYTHVSLISADTCYVTIQRWSRR